MGASTVGTNGGDTSSQCRVLIIDDEPGLAALIGDFLQHIDSSLQTTHERDPRDGLARLDDSQFDCIVTDYDMDPIDGLAVIEAIPADVAAILYTHHRDPSLAARARAQGVAYLPKRADHRQYTELAACIRDQIGN